ncbi:MAG: TetR/AcrR family transcriptional regulator [Desulfatibacillum sp.]|nr:TetR/AcrR family transcriptional regulator [Desulfatibacillum sp.]
MLDKTNNNSLIPTQVKDQDLVAKRRRQIVDAAVTLFMEKGFHKTTTREIARAVGFSIGSLYEYVKSKEDILFLVCDAIHADMEQGVTLALDRASGSKEVLPAMIREYFLVCNRLDRHILLIYQEAKSLPKHWRKKVLENEVRITSLFVIALRQLVGEGILPSMDEARLDVMAHNITVWGHMWAYRGWYLSRHYTIEEYIEQQTAFILDSCATNGGRAQGDKHEAR